MRETFIYGLFGVDGGCVYVGQSVNPQKRSYSHLRHSKGKFFGRSLALKIIRKTTVSDVSRLEKQIGDAYKRKGQATESKWFGGTPSNLTNDPYLIESFKLDWTKTDREIASIRGTSRAAANNLRNRLINAGFNMPQVN